MVNRSGAALPRLLFRILAPALCAASCFGLPAQSIAAPITYSTTIGTGDTTPAAAFVTFDDMAVPGSVQVSIFMAPMPGQNVGDIRGFFFNVNGDQLSGLSITGADVTSVAVDANNVDDLGNGANVHGIGAKFDVGVEFGTPGIGFDDILSATFLISRTGGISLADLMVNGELLFALRLTSVGPFGGSREGSSKLIPGGPLDPEDPEDDPPPPIVVTTHTPEPASLVLWTVAGGAGLLVARRRRKATT